MAFLSQLKNASRRWFYQDETLDVTRARARRTDASANRQPLLSKWMALVLLVGLTLRIVVALAAPQRFLFSDSRDYHQVAANYLAGNGLVTSTERPALRPPLYPFFMAVAYRFGLGITGIRILQAFLGAGYIYLLYLLALTFLPKVDGALAAALLLAVDPFNIVFCGLVLTETLFTGLLLLAVWLSWRVWHGATNASALLLGMVVGLGCLCRDAFLGYIVIAIIIALRSCHRHRLWQALLVLVGTVVVICPWSIRNWLYLGKIVAVTNKAGINLYEALGPGADGSPKIMEMQLPPQLKKLPYREHNGYLLRWTLDYVRRHPGKVLRLAIKKLARFSNPGLNEVKLRTHPLNWILISYSCLVYAGAIVGLLRYYRQPGLWLVLAPVAYFALVHSIFLGSVRYRIPIMPYLQILAAYGLIWVVSRLGRVCKFLSATKPDSSSLAASQNPKSSSNGSRKDKPS